MMVQTPLPPLPLLMLRPQTMLWLLTPLPLPLPLPLLQTVTQQMPAQWGWRTQLGTKAAPHPRVLVRVLQAAARMEALTEVAATEVAATEVAVGVVAVRSSAQQ